MSRHFGGAGPSRGVDRARNIIVFSLVLLVVLSSLGVLLLYSSTGAAKQQVVVENSDKIDMVEVLVPIQPIGPGEPLDPALFKTEVRPRLGLSTRVVHNVEEIHGYYAKSMIPAELPLHGDLVTKQRPNSAITPHIPEGFRAVTIRVDARSSVEGWARPGAMVDVVWASTLRGLQAVTVIVQNAKVLSAERSTNPDSKAQGAESAMPSTVTLLVTADDAAKIQLASTTGTMSLQLRGEGDKGAGSRAPTITIDDLVGRSGDQEPEPRPEGVIRIKKPNGQYEELQLKNGRLVPLG